MEINIKGNPDEISVLIKNILSTSDRQDVRKINESVENQIARYTDKFINDHYHQ